jgi:hypothetical protein
MICDTLSFIFLSFFSLSRASFFPSYHPHWPAPAHPTQTCCRLTAARLATTAEATLRIRFEKDDSMGYPNVVAHCYEPHVIVRCKRGARVARSIGCNFLRQELEESNDEGRGGTKEWWNKKRNEARGWGVWPGWGGGVGKKLRVAPAPGIDATPMTEPDPAYHGSGALALWCAGALGPRQAARVVWCVWCQQRCGDCRGSGRARWMNR